jgi:hypothetical protein
VWDAGSGHLRYELEAARRQSPRRWMPGSAGTGRLSSQGVTTGVQEFFDTRDGSLLHELGQYPQSGHGDPRHSP